MSVWKSELSRLHTNPHETQENGRVGVLLRIVERRISSVDYATFVAFVDTLNANEQFAIVTALRYLDTLVMKLERKDADDARFAGMRVISCPFCITNNNTVRSSFYEQECTFCNGHRAVWFDDRSDADDRSV